MLRLSVIALTNFTFITENILQFDNTNFMSMNKKILPKEKSDFLLEESIKSPSQYVEVFNESVLKNMFKQTEEETKRARVRYRIIKIADFVFKSIACIIMIYIFIKLICFV